LSDALTFDKVVKSSSLPMPSHFPKAIEETLCERMSFIERSCNVATPSTNTIRTQVAGRWRAG
jgi:hypothetical protein